MAQRLKDLHCYRQFFSPYCCRRFDTNKDEYVIFLTLCVGFLAGEFRVYVNREFLSFLQSEITIVVKVNSKLVITRIIG